ncbi:MAG TPA: BON domain-containing protein [Stellaceae bacterium]|nr:BON domain-containing protein [Stellaceae bacterium]
MSEYEDRYPDAYGRREETDPEPRWRRFLGLGLPRQVRDSESPLAEARADTPPVVDIQEPGPTPPTERPRQPRHIERLRRPLVERSPQEICDDIAQQLAASPFIDEAGIAITVDGAEATLAGTVNSLIEISLAKALVSNVPGVARVQVQLRVTPAPRPYETSGGPARKAEG